MFSYNKFRYIPYTKNPYLYFGGGGHWIKGDVRDIFVYKAYARWRVYKLLVKFYIIYVIFINLIIRL